MSTKKTFFYFILFFLTFVLWGQAFVWGYFTVLDQMIYRWAGIVATKPWLSFWYVVTIFGNAETLYIGTFILVVFLSLKNLRKEAVWVIVQMLLCLKMSVFFKSIFSRERPLSLKIDYLATGFSFPSGHALGSLVFYGMCFYCVGQFFPKQKRKFFFVLASLPFLIGMSRIFLGVHWASDVVAGWLLGGAFIFVNLFLARQLNFFVENVTRQ